MSPNSISVGARMPARFLTLALPSSPVALAGQRTQKPPLHGRHWVAITGKPLAATAGAMIFQQGGNPVDAACAMLAAVTTMWDVLSWGGETQALIYNPQTKKVIAINALGVAPTGATPAFYHSKGMRFPPEYGPLAAITPGTPGGLMTMLAEYGKLSLRDVLEPAIRMADGYPIEEETANSIERNKGWLKLWLCRIAVMLPHAGEAREAPEAGEIFKQADLAATLQKLVDAEQLALRQGKSRRDAIMAAYDRFYKGDIAQEFVRGLREEGGLITLPDLAGWKVKIEEPVMTTYRGIDVYKLQPWSQGPAMLEALNILETFDLKAMGYNSPPYIHTVYQAMSLAFADRDFYYGAPPFPPGEPSGHRCEAGGAAVRRRFARQSLQRDRAGEAPAGHTDAEPRAEGREAVPRFRGAGGRHAGPEPAAVLSRHGRVRDDGAGGGRGGEHHELPDAELVRRARVPARPPHPAIGYAALGAP